MNILRGRRETVDPAQSIGFLVPMTGGLERQT